MAFACTNCGAKLSLRELMNNEDWSNLIKVMSTLPQGVPPVMLRYLDLFTPLQRDSIKSGTMLRIVSEITPMIKDNIVIRNRKTYTCSRDLWVSGMLYLIDTPPKTLTLPLKNDNRYLIGMLANKCEKVEAQTESKREESRRQRSGNENEQGVQAVGDLLEGLKR